ncbi:MULTISPECIES: MFS transporter [unclassified Paenibacillus]|uniref:MFS transporter n=1 Tax=unclassified Paenibacillus TaxID=185978 RepID=UPI00039FA531|nr:MFS transporter [Paenibacillus sp. 7541]PAK51113.1 MFS transporter [Paenibacillus sp. 7541]
MNRFAIFLLALGAFVTGTAEFVVSGILELIAEDLDVSIAAAGQLVTFFSLSYAFGALFLVMLTAKFERKRVLLFAMLTFIAGNLIAFFSSYFGLLMFSRIVLAMSGGLYIVIATHYAARLAQPDKRGNAIAIVMTGFSVSLVLGVPFGTLMAAYMDWRYIYLTIAVITLVTFLLLYRFIPKLDGTEPTPWRQQLHLLRSKPLITGLLITVFWILGYTMIFAYIGPFLARLAGFSIEGISTALFVLGVFAFIGARFGGYAVDKWGPVRTIFISLLLHAAALIALSVMQGTSLGVFVILMIWGAAAWTTTPASQFYLISLRPQASETVLSFNTALMNIGMTAGAALGGVVIDNVSVLHLGWLSGMVVLIALATAIYSFTSREKQPCNYDDTLTQIACDK